MPTYSFKCEECDHETDIFMKFADPECVRHARKECPNCKRWALKRIFYPTPVIYKAKGFYSTDNPTSDSGGEK